jgi:acetyl-CoA acetyltransferase
VHESYEVHRFQRGAYLEVKHGDQMPTLAKEYHNQVRITSRRQNNVALQSTSKAYTGLHTRSSV